MGPPGPGSIQYGSRYSMSRTCGPREIISLVIPRLGDNTPKYAQVLKIRPTLIEGLLKNLPPQISMGNLIL